MTTTTGNLTEEEQTELAELEQAFDVLGGRDVDMAERIDYLRLRRDGVDVLVKTSVSDLIFMSDEEFEDMVVDAVATERGCGSGVLSAWDIEIEDTGVGDDIVLRVRGDWE